MKVPTPKKKLSILQLKLIPRRTQLSNTKKSLENSKLYLLLNLKMFLLIQLAILNESFILVDKVATIVGNSPLA